MAGHGDQGHKLFIGDLPPDITQEELHTVFSTYGEVNSIHMLQSQTQSGDRSALLFYSKVESAEDAIKVLDGIYKIREDAEKPIKVAWAKNQGGGPSGAGTESVPPPQGRTMDPDGFKLFIAGLPLDIREEELRHVFGTYGEVNKIHIMPPHQGSGRVAAFIYYQKAESAEDSIGVLDGQYKIRVDADQPIQVKWAQPKDKGGGKGWNNASDGQGWPSGGGDGGQQSWGGESQTTAPDRDGWKLFIAGLPQDVTEDELRAVFGTYGEVTKVHVMAPHAVSGRVAAFIFFAQQHSAEDALKVLDGVYKIREDADQPIQVKWGMEKTKGGDKGGDKGGGKGGGWGSGGGGGWGSAGGWGSSQGSGKGGAHAAIGWQNSSSGWSGCGGGGGWGQNSHWGSGGGGGGWQDRSNSWQAGGGGGGFGGWGRDQKGGWGGDQKGWQGGKGGGGGGSGGSFGGGSFGGGSFGGGKGQKGEVSDTRLFVGNLPSDINEDALKYVFGTYGQVQNVHLMTGKSRTGAACAFVEFAVGSDAETAILTLNDKYEIKPGSGTIMVKKANQGANRSQPY